MAPIRKIKKLVKLMGTILVMYILVVYMTILPRTKSVWQERPSVQDENFDQYHYVLDKQQANIPKSNTKPLKQHRLTNTGPLQYHSLIPVTIAQTLKRDSSKSGQCSHITFNSSLLQAHQQWFTMKTNSVKQQVHLYSAFGNSKNTEIRILTAARGNMKPFCQIWSVNSNKSLSFEVSKSSVHIIPETHGKR